MSTFYVEKDRCAVCRASSNHVTVGSTNRFGPIDLDGRPPEMERDTMIYWVRECPSCGYAAKQLRKKTAVNSHFVKSEAYRTCEGNVFRWKLASRFYRQYMASLVDKNKQEAFFALLHAAWACDDACDTENAIRCRRLAAPLLEELIGEEKNQERRGEMLLVLADLLRRGKRFDDVISRFASLPSAMVTDGSILAFQLYLAERKDGDRYTSASAMRFAGETPEE